MRKIRGAVADQPTGFVWVEEGKLAASGYPASRRQLEWIRNQGIDSVVTLTEKPLPDSLRSGFEMSFDHVPMNDHNPPSAEELAKAVSLVQEKLKAGRKVIVHCLAGEGRTGCVVTAYLMMSKSLSAEEALEAAREIKSEFVEWSQEKSIYEFAKTNPPPQRDSDPKAPL